MPPQHREVPPWPRTTALTSSDSTPAAQSSDGNPFAVAGLVCGVVGLLFLNVVLGPLALVFGGIGWSKANPGARYRGMAIAAVVLGVLDLIVFVVLLVTAAKHGGFMSFRMG